MAYKELAVELDGVIKVFPRSLPEHWEPTNSYNLKSMTPRELRLIGFYETRKPAKSAHQEYGQLTPSSLEFEVITKVYMYPVINKEQTELDLEFINKRKALIKKLESDTDNLIREVVGERANEYLLAEEEATVFKAAGYLDLDVPPSVSSDAIASGRTNTEACDLILAMATNWRKAQKDLRANRLLAKAKVKVAATVSDISLVKDTWNEFLMNLRSQIIE